MIVVKTVPIVAWAEKCHFISLSGLLSCLASASMVSVNVCSNRAFIMAKLKTQAPAVYYYTSQKTWDDAHHIMSIRSSGCCCWRCNWRRKYNRYLDPTLFDPVLR